MQIGVSKLRYEGMLLNDGMFSNGSQYQSANLHKLPAGGEADSFIK